MSHPLYRYFLYLDRGGVGIGYGTTKPTGHRVKMGKILGQQTFVTRAAAEAERVKWNEKLSGRMATRADLPSVQ